MIVTNRERYTAEQIRTIQRENARREVQEREEQARYDAEYEDKFGRQQRYYDSSGKYAVVSGYGNYTKRGKPFIKIHGTDYTKQGSQIGEFGGTIANDPNIDDTTEVLTRLKEFNVPIFFKSDFKKSSTFEAFNRINKPVNFMNEPGESVDFGTRYNEERRKANEEYQNRLKQNYLESSRSKWSNTSAYTDAFRQNIGRNPNAAQIGSVITRESRYQLEAKRRQLQSGAATWASPEFYGQEVQKMERRGEKVPVDLDSTKFYGIEGSPGWRTSEEENNKRIAATQYTSALEPGYDNFNKHNLPEYRAGRSEDEFRVIPRFGQVIPKDLAEGLGYERNTASLKDMLPKGLSVSSTSKRFFKNSVSFANSIRDITIPSEYLPEQMYGSSSNRGRQTASTIFKMGKESVARTSEFVGTIPITTEIWSRTALTDPTKLPQMATVGAIYTVGSIGKQIQTEPKQFMSDLLVTAGLFKGLSKARIATTDTFRFAGKNYIDPAMIIEPQVLSGVERFPNAPRGTTGRALVNEFKTSQYKLPGTEGKIGGWHATPEAFPKKTPTIPGSSESPGLYIAPSTSPHFWKIGSGELKLFGFDAPPEKPTGIWLGLEGVKRSPQNIRYSIGEYNKFMTTKAKKGVAYISSAFEKGIKPEKEAIIPPDTLITRINNKFYTKYKGKKVALMEYTAKVPKAESFEPRDVGPGIGEFWKGKTASHGSITFKKGIISPTSGVKFVGAGIALSNPPVTKGEPFKEFTQRQKKIYSEYTEYKEPIFTPESISSAISSSKKPYYRSSGVSIQQSISTTPSPRSLTKYSSFIKKPSIVSSRKSSIRSITPSITPSIKRPTYQKTSFKYTPKTGRPTPPIIPPIFPKKKKSKKSSKSSFTTTKSMRSMGNFGEKTGVKSLKSILKGFKI